MNTDSSIAFRHSSRPIQSEYAQEKLKRSKKESFNTFIAFLATSIIISLSFFSLETRGIDIPGREVQNQVPVEHSSNESPVRFENVQFGLHRQMIKRLANVVTSQFSSVDRESAESIVEAVMRESSQQGVDPMLILAVVAIESKFDPLAVNGNDHGLMQVNTYWQKEVTSEVGGPSGLLDPVKNIYAGTKVLAGYLVKAKGNARHALRKYNGEGKSNEYPELVLNQKKAFEGAFESALSRT